MMDYLIVRSFGRAFKPVLDHLDQNEDTEKIDALITEQDNQQVEDDRVNQVFTVNGTRFTSENLTEELTNTLKDKNYDRIIILYRDFDALDYIPVEKMSFEISSNEVIGYDEDLNRQSIQKYDSYGVKWKRLIEPLYIIGIAVLSALVLLPYFYIKRIFVGAQE